MSTNGKRVLLVEDDRFLRRACEARLRRCGVVVLTDGDGEEARRVVLVLSNPSREKDVEEVMCLVAVGYFVKANLSLQELGDRVTRLLES